MTSKTVAYDAAIAYATERGRQDGTNAAGWYTQDSIGGRVTGDVRPTAARILRGIEDGDPAVLDTFPFPDLSGQWADGINGPSLYEDATTTAGLDPDQDATYDALFSDICDAYETAFSTAVEDAIGAAARAVLA